MGIRRHRLLLVILGVVALTGSAIAPLSIAKKKHKKVSPRNGNYDGYATNGGKCQSPGGLGPEACRIYFDVVKRGGKKFVTNMVPSVHGTCSDGSTNDFGHPVAGPGTSNGGYASFQISRKGTFSGSAINDSQYGGWISFSIKGKFALYKNPKHYKPKKSLRFQGTYHADWYWGGSKRSVTCHANRKWRTSYKPPGSIL